MSPAPIRMAPELVAVTVMAEVPVLVSQVAVMVAEAGLTDTEATGTAETVMAELPLLPSLVALMVAVPAATPATIPALSTVATEVLSLDQVTARPVSVAPAASFGVAVRLVVPPWAIVALGGVTATVATGSGGA